MAAGRKTTTRKSASRSRGKGASKRTIAGVELPSTLQEFSKQVQRRLSELEKQVVKASTDARRGAARMLNDAARQLGRLEAGGEQGWRKLAGDAQKQATKLLSQLEKAISPKGGAKRSTRRASATAKPRKAPAKATGAGPEGSAAVRDAAAKAASSYAPPPSHS